jgi:F-type H+-transporting ATPase subunit epsilon
MSKSKSRRFGFAVPYRHSTFLRHFDFGIRHPFAILISTFDIMLQCTVVTPECTLYDQPAEFVALTLYDGEIGVSPGHAPLIGRLGNGEMRIRRDSQHTDRYYVEGGFVEVLGDVVSVLTQRAIPAAKIDTAVAREQLLSAQSRRAATPEAAAARDRVVAQCLAQLHVAGKS